MRPGAWLVNVARGALLDTDAAIAHLNSGHLAGIGLDVFPTEPHRMPPRDRLCRAAVRAGRGPQW